MLEMQQVCYTYPGAQQALADVSLAIAPGECIALTGRNGSGKTTLLRLIMGILQPTSGRILLAGRTVAAKGPRGLAGQMAYVAQNPDRQLFCETALQEAAYGPRQMGLSPGAAKNVAIHALQRVGLADLAGSNPFRLARREKQSLALAAALAMQPKLLLLDEPFSRQGVSEKEQLAELLRRLCDEGMAVLMISHDMELVSALASRVVVMEQGRAVYDGDPVHLFCRDARLEKWGLRRSCIAAIARGLGTVNVAPALTAQELSRNVQVARRAVHG